MTLRFPAGSQLILFFILLTAFILRVWGIDFGLPHLYHADEPIVVNHALAYSTGDFNPHFFRIPPLVSYLLFFFYGVSYAAGHVLGIFQTPREFEKLFFSDPSFFYLSGRFLLGVIPGVLNVAVLFLLIRRFFNSLTAFLTAGLFAVSFLHVRDSHYIYVDIPLLLLMTVSFFYILKLLKINNLQTHLAAGALIGFSAAVKYNGLFLVFPFLTASLLGKSREQSWSSQIGSWITSGVTCCAVFALLNPYAILDWQFFLSEIAGETHVRAGGVGLFHHLTYSLSGSVGVPHLIAAAAGVLGITQFSRNYECLARWVILSFVMAYYGVLVLMAQPYDRYVLPLIPFVCFFAADSIIKISSFFLTRKKKVLTFLFIVIAVFPLSKSILAARIFQAPDLRTESLRWIEEHLPSGSAIAMDTKFYMPPLAFSPEALRRKRERASERFSAAQGRRFEYLIQAAESGEKSYNLYFLHDEPFPEKPFMLWGPFIPYDIESLKKQNVDYVIVKDPFLLKGSPEKIKLLKKFSPYKEGSRMETYDREALTGAPFLWEELWNRRQNGQPLWLFEVLK